MTEKGEVRLEQMLGRVVRDADGRRIGRLEEVRAVSKEGEWVVTECHIGAAALLERLAGRVLLIPRFFHRGYKATWDQMDWTRPRDLRTLCRRDELRRFTRRLPRRDAS